MRIHGHGVEEEVQERAVARVVEGKWRRCGGAGGVGLKEDAEMGKVGEVGELPLGKDGFEIF